MWLGAVAWFVFRWLFAAGLVEEPDSPLRLVDPDLDQACRRHVAMLVAGDVGLAHPRGERLVVFAQLREHVAGRHVIGVVVLHALEAADLTDRAQSRAAELADALRDRV